MKERKYYLYFNNEEIKIIEVQKGHPLIEEDIVRYQDIYGRASK